MKFLVEIDTEEALPSEMEEAIKNALDMLEMPNGDTLYIENVKVDFIIREEPAPVSHTWPD